MKLKITFLFIVGWFYLTLRVMNAMVELGEDYPYIIILIMMIAGILSYFVINLYKKFDELKGGKCGSASRN